MLGALQAAAAQPGTFSQTVVWALGEAGPAAAAAVPVAAQGAAGPVRDAEQGGAVQIAAAAG